MTVEPSAEQSPTAAGSGASATQSFRSTEKYRGARGEAASPERVSAVATAMLASIHQVIRDYGVTYPEYQAAKGWLIEVGEGGEWPLFLDVFVEHAVEEVQASTQQGTKGTILGPYYLPGAARLRRPGAPCPCARTRRAARWSSPVRSATSTAAQSPVRRSTSGRPTTTATTPGSRRTCPRATCVAWSSPDDDGRFEITHDPAGAVPDPHRRADRQAHRRCGLAPVAPGSPAPDRRCPRAPRDHHPAVLQRRRVARQRRRGGGEAGADPRSRRPGRRHPGCVTYDFVLEPTQAAAGGLISRTP